MHIDAHGNMFIQGGKLCQKCGGSSYLLAGFKDKGSKLNFIQCNQPRCINGLVTPVDQDPTSPYYEDPTLSGYRPVWMKSGYTREQYAASRQFWDDQMKKHHWTTVTKAVIRSICDLRWDVPIAVAQMVADLKWKQPWYDRLLEQVRLKLNLMYWSIVCAIEAPFAWCVSLNKWVESHRWLPDIQYATFKHSIDQTVCRTINIRLKNKDILSWTARETVGWSIDYWKNAKNWKFFGRESLLWHIEPGKEHHWPAPVWDTRSRKSPFARADYDYCLEMGYYWSIDQARLDYEKKMRDSGRMAYV